MVFAEAKADKISFNHSKEEAEGYEEMHEAFVSNECKELTLKDLLKRNYTKGYKSI